MKTLAKTVKTCAVITVLSAIAAFITGIIFENAKLTSYFLGMFVVLSLINLNIYIILGILGKDTKSESTNSQQDVSRLTQSYLYYNSNAAIDSGKPVNAEPTTCSISTNF